MEKTPTLSEWMGGYPRMEELMTKFYKKVLQNELVGPLLRNMSPEHVKHVAQFVTEVFQGPPFYTTDRKGSHALMIAHHLNRHLTEAQRKRWVNILLDTADETPLPADPE